MGLLDNINFDDPKTIGLLMAAAQLMSPSQSKIGVGGQLSRGLLGGLEGYAGAKSQQAKLGEEAQQSQLRQVQIAQAQQAQSDQQAQRGLAERAFAPAGGYPGGMTGDDNGNPMPPNPMNPGGGGMAEYIQGMTRLNPQTGLAMQAQLAALNQKERVKVAPGETIGTYNNGRFNADFTAGDKLPPGMRQGANGPEYIPEYVAGQKDIRNAGATRVQTNVNAYTPASEAAQAEFMKSSRATYDQLKQAPVAISSIERAKELIPGARGFMGPGGESLLQATKFLNNRLGMTIKTEGVKDAEELRTRIFFNIMDNLKKMDAQPSQQQQQIMQEALGKLGTDPNALPAVLDAFSGAIKGKVDLYNQEVTGASQRGVKFPYDPVIKMGEKTALTKNVTATFKAKQAIQQGADPVAVRHRLREQGYDDSGL